MFNLDQDIILDEEAFGKAIDEFSELSQQLQSLRSDIEAALQNLQDGFDTPAGHQFINSCHNRLLEPLDQQKLVIEHISETLGEVRTAYSKVFDEYQSLNTTIQSYSKK